MMHIYEIPEQRSTGYCFGGGHPISFQNVDWMDEPGPPMFTRTFSDEEIIAHVKGKIYYNPDKAYLILMNERALVIPKGHR